MAARIPLHVRIIAAINYPMTEDDFEGRGPGRPKTGQGVKLNARIPHALAQRIQQHADEEFMTWNAAIRELLERGINGGKK